MDTAARRRELRHRLAERRRALTPPQRMAAAQGLRRSLEHLPEYHTDARVAGYWACDGELPLNLVIPPLATRGQQFLLPLIGQDNLLRFAPWAAGELVSIADNLANNLPAGLVASDAVAQAHPPLKVVDALLIGVDLGPNLSVTGSLATLLWLAAIRREGEDVTAWRFLKTGLVVTPPALLLALAARIWV